MVLKSALVLHNNKRRQCARNAIVTLHASIDYTALIRAGERTDFDDHFLWCNRIDKLS